MSVYRCIAIKQARTVNIHRSEEVVPNEILFKRIKRSYYSVGDRFIGNYFMGEKITILPTHIIYCSGISIRSMELTRLVVVAVLAPFVFFPWIFPM